MKLTKAKYNIVTKIFMKKLQIQTYKQNISTQEGNEKKVTHLKTFQFPFLWIFFQYPKKNLF